MNKLAYSWLVEDTRHKTDERGEFYRCNFLLGEARHEVKDDDEEKKNKRKTLSNSFVSIERSGEEQRANPELLKKISCNIKMKMNLFFIFVIRCVKVGRIKESFFESQSSTWELFVIWGAFTAAESLKGKVKSLWHHPKAL